MKSVRKEVEGRMITFFECPKCNSARTYSRLKTQDRVCYNCGAITGGSGSSNGSGGSNVSGVVEKKFVTRLDRIEETLEEKFDDIDGQLKAIWDRLPELEEEEEEEEDKEKKPQEKCKECGEVFDVTDAVMNTSFWDSVLWVVCPNCNDRVRKATKEEKEEYER